MLSDVYATRTVYSGVNTHCSNSEDGSGTLEKDEFIQILVDEAVKNTLTRFLAFDVCTA